MEETKQPPSKITAIFNFEIMFLKATPFML